MRVWAKAAGATVLLATSIVSAAPAPAPTQSLDGVWWATRYSPSMKMYMIGPGDIPLNDAGKKKYGENQAGLKNGTLVDRARQYCTPDGLPRTLATPYPFQIISGPPGQMAFVYEENTMIRGISMVKPLDPDDKLAILPFWNGHSAGRWEGEILVIDSGGFNENTFIDATGLPHSDQLKTTERIRIVTGGELEDVITIHDPVYYDRDWIARFVYQKQDGLRLTDYVCGEKHRDISKIFGVSQARAANATRTPPR